MSIPRRKRGLKAKRSATALRSGRRAGQVSHPAPQRAAEQVRGVVDGSRLGARATRRPAASSIPRCPGPTGARPGLRPTSRRCAGIGPAGPPARPGASTPPAAANRAHDVGMALDEVEERAGPRRGGGPRPPERRRAAATATRRGRASCGGGPRRSARPGRRSTRRRASVTPGRVGDLVEAHRSPGSCPRNTSVAASTICTRRAAGSRRARRASAPGRAGFHRTYPVGASTRTPSPSAGATSPTSGKWQATN